jgi:pimeloyl-ACP methyl ester carboxylesterase
MSEVVSGQFKSGSDTIAFSRYSAVPREGSTLVSLHGAGPAGRERIDYICRHLQGRAVSSFSFDFTGHGQSSGQLSESSLVKRSAEAKRAIDHSGFSSPNVLIGTSMGAFISLMLLKQYDPSHLILFCPAMYGDAALDVPFDDRFTKILRTDGSFENSCYLDVLRNFKGKTIIFMGTEDKIIPRRVVEIYEEARSGRDHETVWLQGAEHVIHRWALVAQSRKTYILDKLDQFLSELYV